MTRTIDTPKALLVEVPEGATEVRMVGNELNGYYFEVYNKEGFSIATIQFPTQYSYGQPMLASEMEEEEWKAVIEKYDELCIYCCWPDFTREEIFANRYVLDTAAESGQSLLRSHNMKPETTVVIPKLNVCQK